MTEGEEQEEVERVRDWVRRLQAFVESLDDLEGTTPTDFCESACLAWQNTAMSDNPPPASPAALIIGEAFGAITQVMKTVATDLPQVPLQSYPLHPASGLAFGFVHNRGCCRRSWWWITPGSSRQARCSGVVPPRPGNTGSRGGRLRFALPRAGSRCRLTFAGLVGRGPPTHGASRLFSTLR
jgi:hypothetical protein